MSKSNYDIEFEPIMDLDDGKKNFFRVPDSILLNTEMGKVRVALYLYLYIHKGYNNIVNFSVPLFLNWAGYKSDSHKGGINDKVLFALDFISDAGYLYFMSDKRLSRNSCAELYFDSKKVSEVCNGEERFAIVYLDEILDVMNYRNSKKQDRYLNNLSVLLVFAYLRRCIPRRINQLKPEERYEERCEDRRNRIPEAYNGKYKDIATNLDLGEHTVSQAISILQERKLIVVGTPYRIKTIDGEFRTPDFIFANYQKRDNGKLLIQGLEYAKTEINLKAKQMHDYYERLGLNYRLKEIA